jgi:predicted AlkP superfamily phosphohydrolase/phosphomutase
VKKKVIIIGLDGLEPSIVEGLLAEGMLPNLGQIRDQGLYCRLRTTYPALTPVAWSSFATGTNPGRHGIFDFIRRDPETYRPDLALSRFEQPRNMFVGPKVVNRRQGVPFWNLLSAAGVPCTVLRCPCTFPPDSISGRMLSGVGVPDIRGSQGTGTFYTQDCAVKARENEQVIHLDPGSNLTTYVLGPRNARVGGPSDSSCEFRVSVDVARHTIAIRTDASTRIEIREGSWSRWVRLRFKLSMLQSVTALVRFYLKQVSPHVEFYASPVNFDSEAPLYPISSPADYAKDLAHEIGLFGTLGMAEDHAGLNNGRFSEDAYLDQCKLVLNEREKMTLFELDRLTDGVLFVVFDTPDRVQHMFWRFRDPEHPCFDPARSSELGKRIEEHYLWYDELLGRILPRVDSDTLLIVLSDHGFTAFRRAVHVNRWLFENGFLKYRDHSSGDAIEPFAGVDWEKTYAYSIGMSGIYLNMKGRESRGIVNGDGDAEAICRALQSGLSGLIDPVSQKVAVRNVLRREDIYSGTYLQDSPDLILNCAPGFRVSWQTALGGTRDRLFEDNTECWSGDHIVDPEAVPGILFMNKGAIRNQASILDMAPTILSYYGLSKHDSMEGQSLI